MNPLAKWGLMMLALLPNPALPNDANPAAPGVFIVDEATEPATVHTAPARVANPALRAFASELLARLGTAPAEAGLALHILRLPLASPLAPGAPGTPDTGAADCRVRTPWVEVCGPVARVFWNERQLLRDLAALEGAPEAGPAPRAPLDPDAFDGFARAWAAAAIGTGAPPEAVRRAVPGLPPELAYLFSHAPQTTRGPFEGIARSALARIAEAAAACHAGLAARLVARSLDPREPNLQAEALRDVIETVGREGGCFDPAQ